MAVTSCQGNPRLAMWTAVKRSLANSTPQPLTVRLRLNGGDDLGHAFLVVAHHGQMNCMLGCRDAAVRNTSPPSFLPCKHCRKHPPLYHSASRSHLFMLPLVPSRQTASKVRSAESPTWRLVSKRSLVSGTWAPHLSSNSRQHSEPWKPFTHVYFASGIRWTGVVKHRLAAPW